MVYKFFQRLKLIEPEGTLSLTNSALYIVIGKIALSSSFTFPEISAFFISMLAYQGKKLIQPKQQDVNVLEINTKINELESKVTALVLSKGLNR